MSALIFDCETSAKTDGEIIEAAWLTFGADEDLLGTNPDEIPQDLRVTHMHHARFRPERPMSFGAIAVHHILPHELLHLPPASVFRLPEDCEYLIGHSIDYDWQAAGSPASVKRICTHAMAERIWPGVEGYSQVACIYRILGATPETRELVRNAHSAVADVTLNHILLRHILELQPEIRTWSKLWEFSEEARIPLKCPMRKYEGTPLEELDRGFIWWCLDQPWFEEQWPYFKKGLLRVIENDRKAQLAATAVTPEGVDDENAESGSDEASDDPPW